ncbi:MAG: response regulator [Pseudobdellovibrio sp.]
MKKSLIMIIDDDVTFNDMLAACVKKMGHETLQAYGAQQAQNILYEKKIKPELVLCDIKMPEKSGLDFVRENRINNLKLNICMVTGLVDKAALLESLQLGAVDFLTKPIDFNSFADKIKHLLETRT